MTIKDMEERSGLPRANIRYYETQGLLSPTRSPNGYRDYSEDDLATLMKIKLLRELGCSLEEISALQREEAALADVLERRLAALEGEAVSLARAKDLCAKLRADGATYATLDPERYVPKDAPATIPWEPIPASLSAPPRYPWRRFFARGLDIVVANTVMRFFLAMVFRVSLLDMAQIGWRLASAALSLLIILIAEPLMLHRWGTTPGKWVFRLRLVREDGARLSWEDAFGRTFNALLAGCGLTIPLVSLVTYILAFYRSCKGIPQPWAVEGEVFEDAKPGKDFHVLRPVALCGLTLVLSMGLALCGELYVARLPYPQPTTYREFAANYNKISRYQVKYTQRWAAVSTLPDDINGLWYHQAEDGYDTDCYHTGFPHMFFQFADPENPFTSDLVTVGMDLDRTTSDPYYYPGLSMAYALQALEGDYAFFPAYNDLAKRCACLMEGNTEGLKRLPERGWHAYLYYSAVGGSLRGDQGRMVFVPQTNSKFDEDSRAWVDYPIPQHVTLTFRLRRK